MVSQSAGTKSSRRLFLQCQSRQSKAMVHLNAVPEAGGNPGARTSRMEVFMVNFLLLRELAGHLRCGKAIVFDGTRYEHMLGIYVDPRSPRAGKIENGHSDVGREILRAFWRGEGVSGF